MTGKLPYVRSNVFLSILERIILNFFHHILLYKYNSTITLFPAIKKERADREKDSAMIKERIDNERKEIQISVDKVILVEDMKKGKMHF